MTNPNPPTDAISVEIAESLATVVPCTCAGYHLGNDGRMHLHERSCFTRLIPAILAWHAGKVEEARKDERMRAAGIIIASAIRARGEVE